MADASTSITLDVDFTPVVKYFERLSDIANTPEMREAMEACAEMVVEEAKKNLQSMVYDEPHTWYVRKRTSGLYGHTKSGKVEIGADSMEVTVGTDLPYATFVHFGTGLYAENGRGRKTPWVYKGEDGKFHRTVGVYPKPYLTKALQESADEMNNRLNEAIIQLAKRIGVEL